MDVHFQFDHCCLYSLIVVLFLWRKGNSLKHSCIHLDCIILFFTVAFFLMVVLSRRNRRWLESFLSPPLRLLFSIIRKKSMATYLWMTDGCQCTHNTHTQTHLKCVLRQTLLQLTQSTTPSFLPSFFLLVGQLPPSRAIVRTQRPSTGSSARFGWWAGSSLAAAKTRVVGMSLTLINKVALR